MFRSVAGQPIIDAYEPSHKGSGNGVRKRQRLTATAKRQRENRNGMVETRLKWPNYDITYKWFVPRTNEGDHSEQICPKNGKGERPDVLYV